jgi:hypothetical protein
LLLIVLGKCGFGLLRNGTGDRGQRRELGGEEKIEKAVRGREHKKKNKTKQKK